MNSKKTLLWITRTGILIALLVALQWVLGSATSNNQFVVGSAVNLVLIIAAVVSGLYSGAAVAVISPFTAYFFGIGTSFFVIVPFIALGNLVLVLLWSLIVKGTAKGKAGYVRMGGALALGALLKFLTLYITVVKFAAPVLLDLNEKQMSAVTLAFSWPQLVTASIGGAIAILVIPILKKAVR